MRQSPAVRVSATCGAYRGGRQLWVGSRARPAIPPRSPGARLRFAGNPLLRHAPQSSACDPTALKSQQQNGASCGTLHMTASTKKEETFLVLAVMCNVRRPRRALEFSGCDLRGGHFCFEAKRPKVSVYVFGFILPECPGNSRKSDKTAAKSGPGIIYARAGSDSRKLKKC